MVLLVRAFVHSVCFGTLHPALNAVTACTAPAESVKACCLPVPPHRMLHPAVSASRVAPADQQLLLKEPSLTGHLQQDSTASALAATDNKKKRNGSIDFSDEDPDVRAHWALLVAGSSGWYNYRHQADVFHAYQVCSSAALLDRHGW